MAEFVKVASRSELPGEGEAKEFALGARVICIACLNGEYAALDNVCCHQGGPLGQGMVEDGYLVCPWHGWQFDLKTGVPLQNSSDKVDLYPIKIVGEDVLVET